MRNRLKTLRDALAKEGYLLIKDWGGVYHLLRYPPEGKIGEFHDFHDLVREIDRDIEANAKSENLKNWMKTYWEERTALLRKVQEQGR